MLGLLAAAFLAIAQGANDTAAAAAASPTVSTGVDARLRAPFVGLWNCARSGSNYVSVHDLQADGSWLEAGQRKGTWEVTGSQLISKRDGRPDEEVHYDLPVRNGRLQGTTADGSAATAILRAASATAANYAALAGAWGLVAGGAGPHTEMDLHEDGSWFRPGEGMIGFWQIQGNQLIFSFKAHHDWRDAYQLPAVDGVLHGQGVKGNPLALSRLAGATAAASSSAISNPVAAFAVRPEASPSVSLQPFLDTNLGNILAPLDSPGFTQPEVIASIKAAYADGLAAAPAVRQPAYQAAENVCDAVAAAMDERRAALAALRGATATHTTEVNQPLGGTDFGKDEAKRRDDFFTGSQKNAWAQRADILRKNITALYLQEREIERQTNRPDAR
jgi:hypothetical protein